MERTATADLLQTTTTMEPSHVTKSLPLLRTRIPSLHDLHHRCLAARLRHRRFANIIFESWQFLQTERSIDIIAYVLMENHLHWIAAGPELGKRVGEFKSYTARNIIDAMQEMNYQTMLNELKFFKQRHKTDQEFQLWQEGSHPQVIEHEDMMEQKIEYIHQNPVKRGYVDLPEHWRYSIARNYAGQEGIIDVRKPWL